jgi:rhodanese-related sulfurtransferase
LRPVGAVIQNVQQPILLIAEKGKHEEAITRLSRVGFDNVVGYLEGGFEAWKKTGKKGMPYSPYPCRGICLQNG